VTHPNPIGFGLLGFFTFCLSLLIITIGIGRTVCKRRTIQES